MVDSAYCSFENNWRSKPIPLHGIHHLGVSYKCLMKTFVEFVIKLKTIFHTRHKEGTRTAIQATKYSMMIAKLLTFHT
jgi:hypothetical protein